MLSIVSDGSLSIATRVTPNILIAGETSAVRDYAFQNKCEERIQQMLSRGTTLLFVPHSREQVKNFAKMRCGLKRDR